MSRARKGKPSWHKGRTRSDEFKKKISKIKKGREVSNKTRQQISASSLRENNHNYGTRWITDGSNNKKIEGTDALPKGWRYGRNVKHIEGFRGANIKKEK